MSELIHSLIEWVTANPQWTGTIVFLVALSESLAIVGMLIPGVVMMFAAGALIGAGAADFWPLFWLSVAGAVVGDGLSFWLGHHFRDRIDGIWPFSRYPDSLDRGVAFFERYGGKSVAFGRFFGPVRAVIPLVAGMLSMPPWRFVVANVLSALAWAVAYLAPGIALGASLDLASEVAVHLVVMALVLLIGLWLLGWAGHRLFAGFQPLASRLVQWLLAWERRPGWTGRVAAALADPEHPEARGLLVFAGLLVLSVALLVLTLSLLSGGPPVTGIGESVHEALTSLRTPVGDSLMVFVTTLGDAWLMAILSLAILVVLLFRGGVLASPKGGEGSRSTQYRSVYYWLAAVAFAFLVPPLMKYGLRLPRPTVPDGLSPWGFPSAHALRVTVIFGFLGVMAVSLWPVSRRWPVYWVIVLAVFLVAFSRVYLGVHWLSDVIGGVLIGSLWVAALGLAYRHHPHGYPRGWQLLVTAVVVLSVGLLVHANWRQPAEVVRYAPDRPVQVLTVSQWVATGAGLAVRRDGVFSGRESPLNIEFAGDLTWLRQRLSEEGWKPAERLGWHNSVKLLSTRLPLSQLPVFPQVHNGRHEQFLMVKDTVDGLRYAFRLWPTEVRLQDGEKRKNVSLWQGNIGHLKRHLILGWVAAPRDMETLENPSEFLSALPGLAGSVLSPVPLKLLEPSEDVETKEMGRGG